MPKDLSDYPLEPVRRIIPVATVPPPPRREPDTPPPAAPAPDNDPMLDPWPLRGTKPNERTPDITKALSDAADRLADENQVRGILKRNDMTSLPNRFTEKFTQASGVLSRRLTASEARADALIAREAALAKREDEAFLPHEQAANALEKQYDSIERQYDVLANTSPLSDSGDSSKSEKVVVTSADVGKLTIVGEGA